MRVMWVLCVLPMLSACSGAEDVDEVRGSMIPSAGQSQMVQGQPGEAGSGGLTAARPAGLLLEPLGSNAQAELGPTLGGCAFRYEGATLLIAGAPDERTSPGSGVVKVGSATRILVGQDKGGPDYINSGPTMSDGDITVSVDRGLQGIALGLESTQWPADLTVRRGAGNERVFKRGTWTCGV